MSSLIRNSGFKPPATPFILCVAFFTGFLGFPTWGADFDQAVDDFYSRKYENAFISFSVLAAEGDADSASYLGRMYRKGFLVDRDAKKAVEFFQMGIDGGNLMAHHRLGWMHANGEVTGNRDYFSATELWQVAAERGLYKAQDDIGIMYMRGDGVEQNFAIAYAWLVIAKESNPNATAHANITVLIEKMTEEDLRAGTILVSKYRKDYGLE